MDDLFQQMLYGYTFDMRKFKNFQRLARLKTRSKNQTYNLKKKVEEFKERQKQGVADAMEKALQDHKNGIGVNITIKIGNKKLVPNATKGEEGYWTDNEIKSVAKKYAVTYNEVILNAAKQLRNIDLRQKGVQILVVGPKGKTIVNFGVKEGEKKAISGKVSFATVEPVDLASYPTFEEI